MRSNDIVAECWWSGFELFVFRWHLSDRYTDVTIYSTIIKNQTYSLTNTVCGLINNLTCMFIRSMIICIRLANERECKASHQHAIFTRVRINIFIRCLNDVQNMRSWIGCVLLKHTVAYAACALVRCDVVKKMSNIKNAIWLTCNESKKSPGYIVFWLRVSNLSSWFAMIIHINSKIYSNYRILIDTTLKWRETSRVVHHDNSNCVIRIIELCFF